MFLFRGPRKFDEDSVPFDKKPRIARTPVHMKRDVPSAVNSPPDTYENSARAAHVPARKVSQPNSGLTQGDQDPVEDANKERESMEIVGHAFDATEKKKGGTMHSTLDSTSGIGSSLEESGEIAAIMKTGGKDTDRSTSDETDDSTQVEDIDDYEFDSSDDPSAGDKPSGKYPQGSTTASERAKDVRLLKEYEKHVNQLDQSEIYSESMYDDSDGDSLEDSDEDGEYDDEEDYPEVGFPTRPLSPAEYDRSRDQRQSLSKSTRERMESKRIEEEERIMRERQRIEELERQNQLQLESKEQSLRDKLAKEQRDIENLIKRKEKERELEKLKQEKLQKHSEKREDAMREDFWRSNTCLEEIEKAKEVQREKERAGKLKKLQQKREREEYDQGVEGNMKSSGDHSKEGTHLCCCQVRVGCNWLERCCVGNLHLRVLTLISTGYSRTGGSVKDFSVF